MARKILNDTTYTFNPSTKTITLPRYLPREKLILITNVTTNTVIYNFSDATLTATSYTALGGQQTWGGDAGTTTIVLNFNTTSMSGTDKLQFLIDEYEEKFVPAETQLDPTNKLRVTTPQSLIDTDFEYSLQTTKWEFFQSQNFNASIYTRSSDVPLAPVYGGAGYTLFNPSIVANGSTGTISGLTLPSVPPAGSYVYVIDNAANNNYALFRYVVTGASSTSQLVFTTSVNATTTVQAVIISSIPGTATNPTYAAFNVSNNITTAGTYLTTVNHYWHKKHKTNHIVMVTLLLPMLTKHKVHLHTLQRVLTGTNHSYKNQQLFYMLDNITHLVTVLVLLSQFQQLLQVLI